MVYPFLYLSACRELWQDIKTQRVFNKQFLSPYIQSLEERLNGRFQPDQRKKIEHYYGLFIPAVLASSYRRLYKVNFSDEERKRVTLFGILTPVGDDLFDVDKLNSELIHTITYQPESVTSDLFTVKVACEIQDYLLKTVPDKQAYLAAASNVFNIQIATLRQKESFISEEEIADITFKKGGYSVIIYHETIQAATADMWEALFYIGSLMQLANDLFDLHKDLPEGIKTLPSTCQNFKELKRKYIERCVECNQKVMALSFDKKAKKKFLIKMHFIICRGLVALDHFINLERKKGSLFLNSLNRKEIITDMQRPGSVLKWLYFLVTIPAKV